MEYVDGPSLDVVLSGVSLSMDQLDAVAAGAFAGVEAAHERGLVHRDLKPANLLLSISGSNVTLKVADFGLAKVLEDTSQGLGRFRTRTGQLMGTPAYMAPEQYEDAKRADTRADVFSLGALFYEAVTGFPAFDGDSLMKIFTQASSASFVRLDIRAPQTPRRMQQAIHAALQPKPEDRPATVAELKALWFNGAPVPVQPWTADDIQTLRRTHETAQAIAEQLASEHTPSPPPAAQTMDPLSLAIPAASNPPQAVARRSRRVPLAIGAMTVVVLLISSLGLLIGSWYLWNGALFVESTPPDVTTNAETILPDAIVEPADTPSPQPQPIAAAPVTRPQLVDAPTPDSIAAPQPTPAPAVAVPLPAPVASGAHITIGGGVRAYVVDDAGAQHTLDGAIPAGDLWLWVFFDDDAPTRVMRLTLGPDEQRNLTCSTAQKVCR
jgi:serine/threonine protein kinase